MLGPRKTQVPSRVVASDCKRTRSYVKGTAAEINLTLYLCDLERFTSLSYLWGLKGAAGSSAQTGQPA